MSKNRMFLIAMIAWFILAVVSIFELDIGMTMKPLAEVTWGELMFVQTWFLIFGVWFNDKVRMADREEFWESINNDLQEILKKRQHSCQCKK